MIINPKFLRRFNLEETKRKNPTYLMVLVIILIILGGISGQLYYNNIMKKNYEIEIQKLNETISKMEEQREKEIAVAESYKARLEGIKDKDDLLKRDIFVYIDTKYIEIPKSVAHDIADNIISLSKKYNISPELIVGIIQVESSFNPMAVSSKKARGLMQVMPEWVKKIEGVNKITDLHDIDTNINTGIQVLLIHIEEAGGSLSKGLYHYVGKSSAYVDKVYKAIGQFVAFRSTIDDSNINIKNDESQSEESTGEIIEPEQGAEDGSK
jgi:hypothetical protein